ncbi:hypothetical protein J5N97_003559 [Dioscorea zingiberensis]|uniref:non-specific serine/threonine protein kinase n=1 Tax=Dioscorea zingiberensis TaxID=325984 RepID=A0A9D5HQN2_9LILI|nr:hypothetical protein J5N97_003559 [Dioscorea zingiberensis]
MKLLCRAICFLALVLLLHVHVSNAADWDTLLTFKATIQDTNGALRNWIQGSSPCIGNKANWTGIICGDGVVLGLQLENMSLSGNLSLNELTNLSGLRTLSFKNNSFGGYLPDMGKLGSLRSIYLAMNKLSGQIPDGAFQGVGALRKVHFYANGFTGPIPSSLTGLQRLVELRLDNNKFSGSIPDLEQRGLVLVNVSNNNLDGQIPAGLSRMNATLFAGNKDLCGPPLGVTCKASKKPSTPLILSVILIGIGVVLAITGVILMGMYRRRRSSKREQLEKTWTFSKSGEDVTTFKKGVDNNHNNNNNKTVAAAAAAGQEHEQGRLVFVKKDTETFELLDLLKASAEILGGGGSFGSSYKAVLMNGSSMVVKRFKEMNKVSREDFQGHMSRLGRLSHPNLLPYVAYYYRKEEKLLVTDFIPNGSLAALLHDNSGILDWTTRLKIVKGVARGLAYLYEKLPDMNTPHSHLKSSNVLLDASFEPLLTDYGLAPMTNQSHASQVMVAFKSPECEQYGRPSKRSDVWSLGILILEVLTGKSPGNYMRQGRSDTDLVRWVNSVVREEWTGEVFDSQMKGTGNSEGDMLKLLQIGLGCCERNEERRWDISEALHQIEQLRERKNNNHHLNNDEDYSSNVSDTGDYSSRAMTDDDFSFSAKH